MNFGTNFAKELELNNVARNVEDKILERGSFTSLLGSDFDLTINIVDQTENANLQFKMEILINYEEVESLVDEKVDFMVDAVEDAFFDLVANHFDDRVANQLRNYFSEKNLILNGKKIY